MTHLRKLMLEELERRNYAETTVDAYIRAVEHFAQYFRCSPDKLGPDHIREYQVALFRKFKLAPNTVSQRLAALRFLYIQILKKTWSVAETPYPKKALNLPRVLSQEEVAHLIDSALTPFHRIILMTLYATGMRRAELARLKISDIDSQRMVIHVQGGKGQKDRERAVNSRHVNLRIPSNYKMQVPPMQTPASCDVYEPHLALLICLSEVVHFTEIVSVQLDLLGQA